MVLKPSTLLHFHHVLTKRKYRMLFSCQRGRRRGPKGRRLYFLRVPVVGWLIPLRAAPLAQAHAFFSGLLYIPDSGQLLLLSFVAFLLAASCLGSFNLIRVGTQDRFHFQIPSGSDYIYLVIAHIAPLVFLMTVVRLNHPERNHQGLGNRLIIPDDSHAGNGGAIRCRERLGGMLNSIIGRPPEGSDADRL